MVSLPGAETAKTALQGVVPYRFHHLGIRVPSSRAATRMRRELGLDVTWVNVLEEHQCRCHFCEGPGLAVELVVPLSAASSTNAIPHTLHHVGVEVHDIDQAQRTLVERGYEFTDPTPLAVVGRYRI